MEGPCPRQVTVDPPRCSSRQESPGRMPVPDVQWLHRDMGKDSWIFSSCSNAHSSDRPTAAKSGGKIRVPFYIRRKGAEVFCPALAFGGFVDGLQVPVVMRFHHRFQQEVPQTAPYTLGASGGFSAFVACKRNHPATWEDISSGSRHLPEYAERRLPVQNN